MIKHKPIKTGVDLMYTAISALENYRSGEVPGNMALYPVIVVFLGEKAKEHMMEVKQPLDDNWSNAPRIQYVYAEIDGDKAYGTVLKRDESDFSEVYWNSERSELEQAMNEALFDMIDSENSVFSDKTKIKVDYILDTTEDNAEAYYKLYKDFENARFDPQKGLYLMITQGPDRNDEIKSEEILQKVLADRKPDFEDRNIFLISNLQKDNEFIRRIELNYRLVADIIILGGNNDKGTEDEINMGNQVLVRGIKTAAYHIVDRPNKDIGEVAVDAVLQNLPIEAQKNLKIDSGSKLFCEKFEVSTGSGTIGKSGKIEAKVRPRVDNVNANAVLYFPYANMDALDGLKASKAALTIDRIDNATFGTCSLYVEKYIADPIRNFFADDDKKSEVIESIKDDLIETFNYFEFLAIKDELDIVKADILGEYRPEPYANNEIVSAFGHILEEETTRIFYEHYKKCLWEALEEVIKMVDAYGAAYKQIKDEMAGARRSTGDEEENLENFYKVRVVSYLSKVNNAKMGEIPFGRVFNIRLNKQEILEAIFAEYIDYINSDEIYTYGFEQELESRSASMDENARTRFVENQFNSLMEGSMRLNNSPNKNFQIASSIKYYLINVNAKYAGTLKELRRDRVEDFHLFNLNRTDCVEKLEIYTIKDTKEIHLINPNK